MNTSKISLDQYRAILFDFDGVLAESMHVKTEAFQQMFQPYGEDIVAKIVDHHVKNGGISRYKKIEHFYQKFLQQPLSDQQLNDLADTFSTLVVDKVISSPWVPGVKKFLDNHYQTTDFYVVSGTPQPELDLVVSQRKMQHYFKGVHGTPDTKPVLIHRILKEQHYRNEEILYIGDALSDYQAAEQTQVPFLGRVPKNTQSMFPPSTTTITDFFDVLK